VGGGGGVFSLFGPGVRFRGFRKKRVRNLPYQGFPKSNSGRKRRGLKGQPHCGNLFVGINWESAGAAEMGGQELTAILEGGKRRKGRRRKAPNAPRNGMKSQATAPKKSKPVQEKRVGKNRRTKDVIMREDRRGIVTENKTNPEG